MHKIPVDFHHQLYLFNENSRIVLTKTKNDDMIYLQSEKTVINNKKWQYTGVSGGNNNMVTTKISLQAINDVKEFVNVVMRYEFDIDLVSGRYAVDAKSIMGIFSLDLSKSITLNAHTDDAAELLKSIDKFIIK